MLSQSGKTNLLWDVSITCFFEDYTTFPVFRLPQSQLFKNTLQQQIHQISQFEDLIMCLCTIFNQTYIIICFYIYFLQSHILFENRVTDFMFSVNISITRISGRKQMALIENVINYTKYMLCLYLFIQVIFIVL